MEETVFEAQDYLMNTTVEQKILGSAPGLIYHAAMERLSMLESMLSLYRDDSEVSRLNRQAGISAVQVSEDLLVLLEYSQEMAILSDHAFNIMLAPLVQLWRSSGEQGAPPPDSSIQEVLALCNSSNLVLDKAARTAYLDKKGSMVDLGGIAKGYAADVCCDIYLAQGASSAFINIGGNVKALGKRLDGTPWVVGIQHPDKPRGICYGVLMCSNCSIVTSGAYERYQEIKGVKYHHILDGRTGHPSESNLKSVTVVSRSSMQADALSTAAFVLGLEKGIELIYASKCIGAMLLTDANEVYMTKSIKNDLKLFEDLSCYEV